MEQGDCWVLSLKTKYLTGLPRVISHSVLPCASCWWTPGLLQKSSWMSLSRDFIWKKCLGLDLQLFCTARQLCCTSAGCVLNYSNNILCTHVLINRWGTIIDLQLMLSSVRRLKREGYFIWTCLWFQFVNSTTGIYILHLAMFPDFLLFCGKQIRVFRRKQIWT